MKKGHKQVYKEYYLRNKKKIISKQLKRYYKKKEEIAKQRRKKRIEESENKLKKRGEKDWDSYIKRIRSEGGKKGGKKANLVNKKNGTGFYSFEVQSKGGKIGGKRTHEIHPNQAKYNGNRNVEINKNRKKGIFDPKVKKKAHLTNKRNKTGAWGVPFKIRSERGKKAVRKTIEYNRKHKTGYFQDPEIHRKNGLKTSEILRKRKNIKVRGNYFASYGECEIGICIIEQLNNLIKGKTFQVKVGSKLFDFYIPSWNCFIEFHPVLNFLYPHETRNNYFKSRRNVLNENGLKESNLIIIP